MTEEKEKGHQNIDPFNINQKQQDIEQSTKVSEEERVARQFKKDIRAAEELKNIGSSVVNAYNTVGNDDYGKAGYNKEKEIATTSIEAMKIVSAKAAYKVLQERAETRAKIAEVYEQRIANNELHLSDLSNKEIYKEIKRNVKKGNEPGNLAYIKELQESKIIEGIREKKDFELKGKSLKETKLIYSNVIARNTLDEYAKTIGFNELIQEQKEFVSSGSFYHNANSKDRKKKAEIISMYMKKNPDPLLREINLRTLSDKKVKELNKRCEDIKTSRNGEYKKNKDGSLKQRKDGLALENETDKHLIHMYAEDRKLDKYSKAMKKDKKLSRTSLLRKVKNKMLEGDGYEVSGIEASKKVYTGVKVIAKTIKVVGGAALWAFKKTKIGKLVINSKPVKISKTAKKTVKKNIKDVKYKITNPIKKKVTGTAKKIGNKKAIKVTKKVTKKVLSPARLLRRAIRNVLSFITHAKIAILGTIAGVVILYMILVVVFQSVGAITELIGGAVKNFIGFEDDEQKVELKDLIEYFDDERLQECIEYAEAEHTIYVNGGNTVNHYGNPDTIEGAYQIFYVNSLGYDLGNKVSNIKDVLCITAAVFGNDFSDKSAVKAFVTDLYNLLCPAPEYQESEVYHCLHGCSTYSYHCNVFEDYSNRLTMIDNGCGFYANLEFYKTLGCAPYTKYCSSSEIGSCTNRSVDHYSCNGHTTYCSDLDTCTNSLSLFGVKLSCNGHTTNHGSNMSSPCDNCTTYYVCNGHEVSNCLGHEVPICWGHRNLSIYNKLLFKEDMYEMDLPSNSKYQKYVDEFIAAGGFEQCKTYIDNLYNQDWYQLYGFDINGGVGFNTEECLSEDEINAILANLPEDLSTERKTLIEYSLNYVGKIPYYWGGHASSVGWDNNNFGTYITPDHKGRNLRGLDCAGFVSWVLCSSTDLSDDVEKDLWSSTATIMKNFDGHYIPVTDLKPGDIALKAQPGASDNHVGIYAGKDADGKNIWIHCNGSTNNVACNKDKYWKYYFRVFTD